MAKKDFNKVLTRDETISEQTKSFFSSETLAQAELKQQPKPKEKRAYTKFKSKENKTHTITMRLTDKEYNKLLKQVEQSGSGTISNYITQLLERGL